MIDDGMYIPCAPWWQPYMMMMYTCKGWWYVVWHALKVDIQSQACYPKVWHALVKALMFQTLPWQWWWWQSSEVSSRVAAASIEWTADEVLIKGWLAAACWADLDDLAVLKSRCWWTEKVEKCVAAVLLGVMIRWSVVLTNNRIDWRNRWCWCDNEI